jgi:hypothetical protein
MSPEPSIPIRKTAPPNQIGVHQGKYTFPGNHIVGYPRKPAKQGSGVLETGLIHGFVHVKNKRKSPTGNLAVIDKTLRIAPKEDPEALTPDYSCGRHCQLISESGLVSQSHVIANTADSPRNRHAHIYGILIHDRIAIR